MWKDEITTRKFLTEILQPLQDDEIYLILLTTRKKYYPILIRSNEGINKAIIRDNDINRIIQKIKRICHVDGLYNEGDINIPKEAFALYILLDPRSTIKALSTFHQDIGNWLYPNLLGSVKDLSVYRKIDGKLYSAIHKSRSRRLYTIIDMDKKDEEMLKYVIGLLGDHIKWISETHGGFHIICEKNNESGKIIYTQIKSQCNVEILKEPMTAIPGILQGGFMVIERHK